MEIEGLIGCEHYKSLIAETKKRLPASTPEKTVRQVAWLYVQYGCNNYTDTKGYPFRPEDVQDAVCLSKQDGMKLARWLTELGLVKINGLGRCYFPDKWL